MPLLRGLLDRLLLIAAAITGGLVPGFIAQYRQRLGGRLDQAQLDLAPWQHIADQYHHGSLQALIDYHLNSRDLTFHAEGAAIQALVDSLHRLQGAVASLQGTLFNQMSYLAFHTDPELARATWYDWVPTLALSAEGLIVAVAFALTVWLFFHALWRLVAWSIGRWRGGAS
jgi:hypothetical protein